MEEKKLYPSIDVITEKIAKSAAMEVKKEFASPYLIVNELNEQFKKNGNIDDIEKYQENDLLVAYGVLLATPTTSKDLIRQIGSKLIKKGSVQKQEQISKKSRGRPSSPINKALRLREYIEIYFKSTKEGDSYTRLCREFAEKINKSESTIRRDYERFINRFEKDEEKFYEYFKVQREAFLEMYSNYQTMFMNDPISFKEYLNTKKDDPLFYDILKNVVDSELFIDSGIVAAVDSIISMSDEEKNKLFEENSELGESPIESLERKVIEKPEETRNLVRVVLEYYGEDSIDSQVMEIFKKHSMV
ncbi:hypothetical protein AVO42_11050 [Thiomicrospira sp. XS5]|uniref:hypothetical protein n=1 Tax=Thiomicrospira sp. XS5 TaxID=1775636 RepID=UPI00074AECB9|nr:hypothetical protein [Thiomicrospira sp. XS5]KUJ75809.1 hypothetical protein AVO42_11050 [Thiomicrospira sp. XS5]